MPETYFLNVNFLKNTLDKAFEILTKKKWESHNYIF